MGAIQLVVGVVSTPSATDAVIKSLLESLGHTVVYVDDDTAENTTGFNGVVILDSCNTASLGTKYDTVALPVITHEGFYVDSLRMSDIEGAVAEVLTTFTITDDTHPFVKGPFGSFTGTLTWASSGTPGVYINDATVNFGAGVDHVARSPTDANFKTLFAYEAGDNLASGTAPAKRGYISLRDTAGTLLTSDFVHVLLNAYTWAFGRRAAWPRMLDNFIGADGSIDGRAGSGGITWEAPVFAAHTAGQIGSNAYLGVSPTTRSAVTLEEFGPDCEMYVRFKTIPSPVNQYIVARLQNDVFPIPGNYDLYSIRYTTPGGTGNDNFKVNRTVAASGTDLTPLTGAETGFDFVVGDVFGFKLVEREGGTDIAVILNGFEIATYRDTDASRPINAGHFMLEFNNDGAYDRMYGGTIAKQSYFYTRNRSWR